MIHREGEQLGLLSAEVTTTSPSPDAEKLPTAATASLHQSKGDPKPRAAAKIAAQRNAISRPRAAVALEPARDRLMRRPEVERITGLSRSSLYRLLHDGFPKPIRLSAKSVAWLASEVDAWIEHRVAVSRSLPSKPE